MITRLHLFNDPVENVTRISSFLLTVSLVENKSKSDENSIIFLGNAMEIPWLELVQNPCNVFAWKTNKTRINDMKWCQFWSNCRRLLTWNDIKFPGESLSHFSQDSFKILYISPCKTLKFKKSPSSSEVSVGILGRGSSYVCVSVFMV